MADPFRNKDLWSSPDSSGEPAKKWLIQPSFSNITTLLLTIVIIAIGFLLPTMLSPLLDSYRDSVTQLSNPSEDMVSSHVFEEPVTLYPWSIYDTEQTRNLTSYEASILEQSGVADLLVSNMQLRGVELAYDYEEYINRILDSFRALEPIESSEPGCFVLVDADIDFNDTPDVRCAVDFSGNLISLLFVSEEWDAMQLTAPIEVSSELPSNEVLGEKKDSSSIGEGDTEEPPATTNNEQVDFRPVQEDESVWLFSYVMSREALIVGQTDVYTTFRQLDLNLEERFGYPFLSLIDVQSEYVENLPEIEPATLTTRMLATGNHLLRIYDFSTGERLILYINTSTQACDGFNLSTIPV